MMNAAKCDNCGETVWSTHRHDYHECACGKVMRDGGWDYVRSFDPADETEPDWLEALLCKQISDAANWNPCNLLGRFLTPDISERERIKEEWMCRVLTDALLYWTKTTTPQ